MNLNERIDKLEYDLKIVKKALEESKKREAIAQKVIAKKRKELKTLAAKLNHPHP